MKNKVNPSGYVFGTADEINHPERTKRRLRMKWRADQRDVQRIINRCRAQFPFWLCLWVFSWAIYVIGANPEYADYFHHIYYFAGFGTGAFLYLMIITALTIQENKKNQVIICEKLKNLDKMGVIYPSPKKSVSNE